MLKTDETIIADLKHIARTSQPVDLLNVYRGVPVMYKAELVKVGNDRATVRFEPQFESVCLTLENKTTLLSDVLAGPVNATALAVDLRAGTAALTQFHYTQSKIGDRMTVRVMPHDVVEVTLNSGKQEIAATLADLSMSGLGLHISPPDRAVALRRKAVVQLALKLDGTPLDLSGTIHYIKYEANACRLGVTLVQTREARTLVHYIHQRQEAILQELQTLYQATVK
jgi:hypothetical protein